MLQEEYIKEKISAPITKGEKLGRMDYYYGDKLVKQVYMLADKDYEKQAFILRFLKSVFTSIWFYIVLFIVAFLYIASKIVKYNRKMRRRRRADAKRRNNFAR